MSRHIAVRRTAMAAALSAAFSIGALLAPVAAHAAAWAPTATQATPLKNVSGITPMAASAPMHITVGLNMLNKAQLDSFIAGMGKPGSASFGKVLTPQQFLQSYAPASAQTSAVMSYLSQSGFSNLKLSDNHMSITADGTAAAVQKAFNTQMVQFALNGKTVFANSTAAQVPASLGGVVAAVVGLHNVGAMQTMLAQNEAAGKVLPKQLSGSRAAATSAATGIPQIAPELNAAAFQTAYDAGTTTTAWGTTIGIVTEGDITQVPIDLRQYEKENSLPQVPFEIVATGTQTTDTAGTDEWDLDSQSSSGIAGNLKKIIFYNAGSLGDADLLPAYQKIVSENRVKAVNMSYGGCETLEYLSGGMLVADLAYEQGAAQGITFFASSGDAGAACGLLINLGLPDLGLVGAVEYPSSSPYVVAVGGTTLLIDSANNYISELSWDAGGGGNSLWESAPLWQNSVVPLGNSTTALRGTPDIAMDADNQLSPAIVVVDGADEGVGGTSLSSPLSVGTWARMQTAHGNCYGFAAPIFYAYAGASYLAAPKDFHDVVLGTNGLYVATPGWDYTTGIGSFDITKVNADLPPVSCLPGAPDGLTAGVISGQVLLNWNPVPGASNYAVYVSSTPGGEGAVAFANTTNTSTLLKGLGGKTFYFEVKAINAVGASPASNEASLTLPALPTAPTKVTAQTSPSTVGGVKLFWNNGSGVASYSVYMGTSAGGEGTVPALTGLSPTTVNTLFTGLTSGKTYYFQVTTVNSVGAESAKSVESSATAK
jgi:pseudomonalisin